MVSKAFQGVVQTAAVLPEGVRVSSDGYVYTPEFRGCMHIPGMIYLVGVQCYSSN